MKKLEAILLIDDDSVFTWLTKNLLESMEVVERVECLDDGEVALDYLSKLSSTPERLEKYCPEIIFLDITMPGINGFEFLELLQQLPGCENVCQRVVVLSSSTLQLDIERAMSYQIHAYLEKPLTEEKVHSLLKSLQQVPVAVG